MGETVSIESGNLKPKTPKEKAYDSGYMCAAMDKMEGVSFASIGGGRFAPPKVSVPDHKVMGTEAKAHEAEWLRGYETYCSNTFGADWRENWGWR